MSRSLVLRAVDAPLRWQLVGIAAALVAASGLFGGLERAHTAPKVPTIEVGTGFDAGPWTVTVTGARLVPTGEPLKLETPGDRWLAVLATVEVTADASRSDISDAVRLSGVSGLRGERGEPAYVYLVRDTKTVNYLNPKLPERLAYIWEQDGSVPAPTVVDVVVNGMTHRIDSLSQRLEWLDPGVRARLRVPVEDRRQ
jgi:hypothetical protein